MKKEEVGDNVHERKLFNERNKVLWTIGEIKVIERS